MATTRVVVALVAILLLAPRGVGQDPLVAAATAREKATQSVDVRFHITELVTKGSYTEQAAEMARPGTKTGQAIPAQDTTLESDNRLVLDGSKARVELRHPLFQLPAGTISKDRSAITTINGELSRSLVQSGSDPKTQQPWGVIRPGLQSSDLGHFHLLPLMMHFRGTTRDRAPYLIQSLKNTERTQPIGTRTCKSYTSEISKDKIAEFWFDTETYELVRLRKLRRGVPYEQYDIEYQAIPNAGSAPKSWVRTEYTDAGKLQKSSSVTVTEIAINSPPNASEFEIVFPPGCKVHDQRVRKEYLVAENGDFRELDLWGNETSTTIAPPGSSWFQRNRWLSIGLLVALLVVCAWLARRWRSRATAEF